MRLSETDIARINIGDRVTSAVGNPGRIAQIILDGQTDVFGRQPDGRARLLILWNHQKWSHVDHEMAGEIEMGDIPRAHYATNESPDDKWIIIDGSGGLASGAGMEAIRRDIGQNWSNHMQVRIVHSPDGSKSETVWSGAVHEMDEAKTMGGGTDVLGTSIDELVPPNATVIVYTDGWVADPKRLHETLAGRPHQIIVMTSGTGPAAHTPPELRLRRRDVRYSA